MMCRILLVLAFVDGSAIDDRDLFSRRLNSRSVVGAVSKKLNNARTQTAHDHGMQWFYTWDTHMSEGQVTNANGSEFLPQQWTVQSSGVLEAGGATQPTLLMYNEPDNPGQSHLCYANGQLSADAARQMA